MTNIMTTLLGHTRRLTPVLTALFVTACSHAPVSTDTSPELAAQAQLFKTRCSTCHALPSPRRHNYEEWQILLGVMEQRMQERGMNGFSEQDRASILAYLKREGR